MIDVIKQWYQRYFTDPQAVILAVILLVGFIVVYFMGHMLLPLLASVVLAYLLEGLIRPLQNKGVSRGLAVGLVFTLFIALMAFIVFGLLPLLSYQVVSLAQQLPDMVTRWQEELMLLPQKYPEYITEMQLFEFLNSFNADIKSWGQKVLSVSLSSIPVLITFVVYAFLVPVLVFFLLKDKEAMIGALLRYLPKERRLADQVWGEMDRQIGNYVRGKFVEVLITGLVTYALFAYFGLAYAPLLAALVGLSVVVPYVGVVVVTVPVALIAYFQFGFSPEFAYLMLGHGIIQALDGVVLVPLLFSEAVNLHPVSIIVAVLVFGGLWGFWGVFFAIPLATLVKAVINAWPKENPPDDHSIVQV